MWYNEFHIGTKEEPWLNNHVANLISPTSTKNSEIIYSGQSLTVTISSLESIFKDKIIASRTKDRDDITKLMQKLNKRDLKNIMEIFEHSDGTVNLPLVFDSYIRAFGEEALDDYLQKHPEMERYL